MTFFSDVPTERTLGKAISFLLTQGCQEETLDIASRVLSEGVVGKLAISVASN